MVLLKALCWVLIFIIRIRFPPDTSLATVLKFDRENSSTAHATMKLLRGRRQIDFVHRSRTYSAKLSTPFPRLIAGQHMKVLIVYQNAVLTTNIRYRE